MDFCVFHKLTNEGYSVTWDKQKQLFQQLIENKKKGADLPHHCISVEHPHVYTFGLHAKQNNMLATPEMLQGMGAETYEIERGGDITYHGPGQLVVYPILDLEKLGIGLKAYVEGLESCIISVLSDFGIKAGIIKGRVGVWVDIGSSSERKIAAIGIKSSRYITMHGIALNVNTDLKMFSHIVPCGIVDKGVTSMEIELNEKIDLFEVNQSWVNHFCRKFGVIEQNEKT
jgi:lipoyl(octanoyl) transferase